MSDISKKHEERRVKLFQEMINMLEKDIFSDDLLKAIESNCGFAIGYHQVLFPDGKISMMQGFEKYQDNLALTYLQKKEKPKKIREQIALALETRIMDVMPKNALINNRVFFASPFGMIADSQSACNTCDAIWRYAGDQSTDFNYYTKRGLLLSIYLSSRVFYFADTSQNHEETRKFIKNGLDNIINIASLKHRVKLPKIEDIPILRLFS